MSAAHGKNNVLVFVPDGGFNETEYRVVCSAIRRMRRGLSITSDARSRAEGENGLKVQPEIFIENVHTANFSAFVLIGGRGALNAAGNTAVLRTVQKFHKSGKIIAAICLAPVILARAGILSGKEAVCHQSGMKELSAAGCAVVSREVVRSGNIITASGPEAAVAFANLLLQIV